jgi:hypothetical protein
MYITITANGQMYAQDPPAIQPNVGMQPQYPQQQNFASPSVVPQMQQPTSTVGQTQTSTTAATQQTQQQPQTSKASIVGNALKGALGMYMQYKYGSSMMGGMGGYPMGGYPMMGGYPTYATPSVIP